MRVIIIEDEIPAYNKLEKYLYSYSPEAKIIGWFRSIEDSLIEKSLFQDCDLILSDVQLVDGISLDLFESIKISCPIIFCTAYNMYLQKAFDLNGIAYLVKPYSQESFNKVLDKYQLLFSGKTHNSHNSELISSIEKIINRDHKKYKERFSIRKPEGIIIRLTDNIMLFKACGDFVMITDSETKNHSIKYKISQIESLVDPQNFFQINRSEIVNISFIEKVEPYFKNKMEVTLKNNIKLYTSGSKTPKFKLWIDGVI